MGDLKPGWKRVMLGDVVDVVTDYWDRDPDKPERFVAGEHIDEGTLKVARWGMTSDELVPPTFNRRFKAGDVLFHSRNLRKLARPDFSGITGEKLFVLRSKSQRDMNPELLPFLLQTNAFNEYVNSMWAGSTNKFLNKAPLIRYEFALPPPEEQRRFVLLFAASSAAFESIKGAAASLATILSAWLMRAFPLHPHESLPLSEWCKNVITYGIVQAGPHIPDGVPYIRVSDISDGKVHVPHLLRTTKEIAASYSRSEVAAGDLVVALRGPIGLAVVVPSELHGANLTQGTARVSVKSGYSADYIRWALRSPAVQRAIAGAAKGSTFKEVTLGSLRQLAIPWLASPLQASIAANLNQLDDALRLLQARVITSRRLHSEVLQALEGVNPVP